MNGAHILQLPLPPDFQGCVAAIQPQANFSEWNFLSIASLVTPAIATRAMDKPAIGSHIFTFGRSLAVVSYRIASATANMTGLGQIARACYGVHELLVDQSCMVLSHNAWIAILVVQLCTEKSRRGGFYLHISHKK